MDNWTLTDFRDLALDVASKAAALVVNRPDHLDVQGKSTPTDVVTQMDRASEDLLVRCLLDARPDDSILGEEGTARRGASDYRWVIDPLDGTVNYLYDLPMWSVCVGLERLGEPVVGVVAAPAMETVFYASLGGGAFEQRSGQPPRRLRVGGEQELSMALVGTGFTYSAQVRARQAAVASALLPRVRDIRRMGSAAFDLCTLAAGRLDAYYESGLNPWDYTAATVIAREAGARVAGWTSDEPSSDMVIAANEALWPLLHSELIGLLKTDRD